MKTTVTYRLDQGEYREFVRWYDKIYLKNKEARWGSIDFTNLLEQTTMRLEEEFLLIRSETIHLRMFISAVSELHETERLIIFFNLKEFWAIPKKALGSEEAVLWKQELESRRRTDKNRCFSFAELEHGFAERNVRTYRWIRTVEEVVAACLPLGFSKRELKQQRKLNLFPYRFVGEQLLAVEAEALLYYSERAVVICSYGEFAQAFHTETNLYLLRQNKTGIIVPLAALGGLSGAEELVRLCRENGGIREGTLRLKKRKNPPLSKWNLPWLPYAAAGLAVALLCAAGAGAVRDRLQEADSGKHAQSSEGTENQFPAEYTVMVPDDTVFDEKMEDNTFVSSNLFYKLTLPEGEWEAGQDVNNSNDLLTSDWGTIRVSSNPVIDLPGIDIKKRVPRTREAYLANFGGTSGMEVLSYSAVDSGDSLIIRREVRSQVNGGGYCAEIDIWGPSESYQLSVLPKEDTKETIQAAGAVLDSFRIVDTSAGICREMEEKIFHGYYGRNVYMTSCLVRMDRKMSREEIEDCLDKLKKIKKTVAFTDVHSDTLAVRAEGSSWLGIDCPSIQQNCYKDVAKKAAKIFQSDVILYDEFDGDLLMVAYSDAEQKHAYQRAASFNKEVLEQEFGCRGKEQELPAFLLDYIDISQEEAEAIWKEADVVFQMEKWQELTSHMTKLPVPEEFIGLYDTEALDEGFEVIKR